MVVCVVGVDVWTTTVWVAVEVVWTAVSWVVGVGVGVWVEAVCFVDVNI